MPERIEDSPQRVVIGAPDGRLPMFAFQHSLAPRAGPTRYPEQVHLDLAVEDLDGLDVVRARALQAGAINLYSGPNHHVYADPAGHPFCM